MANRIRLRIKDQLTLGVRRVVILEGIQYLDYSLNEARIIFIEKYISTADVDIEDSTILNRRIVLFISNNEKVTDTGIPITLQFIKSTRPIKVDETPDQYEVRMQNRLETELASGIKQFDYWIDKIINPIPTLDLIKVFNNLGKFD